MVHFTATEDSPVDGARIGLVLAQSCVASLEILKFPSGRINVLESVLNGADLNQPDLDDF